MGERSTKKSAKAWGHILFGTIGVGSGFGGSIFGFHFKNLHTGIWGITTGTVGAVALHLAILHKAGLVDAWYTPKILAGIIKIAIVFQVIGLIGTVAYITIAIVNHHGTTFSTSFYYTAIENILTFFLGLYLTIFAWKLKVKMERQYASLLGGVRAYPEED